VLDIRRSSSQALNCHTASQGWVSQIAIALVKHIGFTCTLLALRRGVHLHDGGGKGIVQ